VSRNALLGKRYEKDIDGFIRGWNRADFCRIVYDNKYERNEQE
jgi:hypothetical protein